MDKKVDDNEHDQSSDYEARMSACVEEMQAVLDKHITPQSATSRALVLSALVTRQTAETRFKTTVAMELGFAGPGVSASCTCANCVAERAPKAKA